MLLTVDIPYPLLKLWHEHLADLHVEEETCESHTCCYVDLFKLSIPGNVFAITDDPDVRSDVNKSLGRIAGLVKSEYRKAGGGTKRDKLDTKRRRFHILEGMVVSTKELRARAQIMNEQWRIDFKNLEEEKQKLYEEMVSSLQEKDQEMRNLKETNSELVAFIEYLENKENFKYKGKDVESTSKKSRTLNTFMTRAKLALWFDDSFGLEIDGITVKEKGSGKVHHVQANREVNLDGQKGFDGLKY